MKKCMLTRMLTVVMAVILLGTAAFAAAVPETTAVQPRYVGVNTLNYRLEITAAGRADCYSYMLLDSTAASGRLTMELQQSDDDGASWTVLKTWDTSGSMWMELDESWYVASGYRYRVHIWARTYDADDELMCLASQFSDAVDY